MKCKYHPNAEAQVLCEKCRNPICPECTLQIDGQNLCHQCIQTNLFSELRQERKSSFTQKFLFFCSSLIPGAAHMQMGLMRRGLQLMILALGVCVIADYINLDFFIPLIVIPTWFFSFFESHSLKRRMTEGQLLCDHDLFEQQMFDYSLLFKNRRILGIIITVLGFLSLLRVIENSYLVRLLFRNWDYYYMLKSCLIPILLILSGIYLIVKARQNQKTSTTISNDQ
ncbi:hypothetical protein ACPUYX_15620 [Desulfosporosinus sp. SYSU MS00001]|uniref:hypothetical protein n=1 Tax=Desulfosporosinus sp. SYSU MS00001 TaxID=3416284 RepID=UPI003CF1412A